MRGGCVGGCIRVCVYVYACGWVLTTVLSGPDHPPWFELSEVRGSRVLVASKPSNPPISGRQPAETKSTAIGQQPTNSTPARVAASCLVLSRQNE